ncbi:MAG: hypothetical protein JWQ11_964 [Rhizobacter sp.]|nr:hypothetical protein [Rhizobacter sp.]
MAHYDHSLVSLLDLNGQTLVFNERGNWVKFIAYLVDASDERPFGLSYSLTMHALDGTRLVGFDNAHQVKGKRIGLLKAVDHKHRLHLVKPYEYSTAGTLLADFWKEIESVIRQTRGES